MNIGRYVVIKFLFHHPIFVLASDSSISRALEENWTISIKTEQTPFAEADHELWLKAPETTVSWSYAKNFIFVKLLFANSQYMVGKKKQVIHCFQMLYAHQYGPLRSCICQAPLLLNKRLCWCSKCCLWPHWLVFFHGMKQNKLPRYPPPVLQNSVWVFDIITSIIAWCGTCNMFSL